MNSQNKKKKNKTFGGTIKLMPVGKDGKEVDWFHGWPGIIKYTEALKKSWVDVGQLIEDTWGDRVSFYQIITCSEVYKSLKRVPWAMLKSKPGPEKHVLQIVKKTDGHPARPGKESIRIYFLDTSFI